MLVFSAFSLSGLRDNAVLPGRIGELARVAVLTRKLRLQGRGQRHLGGARRHGVRAPALRPRADGGADPLRAAHGADPALGDHEPRCRGHDRVRAVRVRLRERAAPPAVGGGGPRPDPPAGGDEPARARRAARAGRGGGGGVLPVPRLALPVPRGLHGDAGLPHPLAAPRGRARAAADERGDALPALAREHRPAAGGDRAAAALVRRARGEGDRVRLRASGDRGLGGRRRRLRIFPRCEDSCPGLARGMPQAAEGGGARGSGGE